MFNHLREIEKSKFDGEKSKESLFDQFIDKGGDCYYEPIRNLFVTHFTSLQERFIDLSWFLIVPLRHRLLTNRLRDLILFEICGIIFLFCVVLSLPIRCLKLFLHSISNLFSKSGMPSDNNFSAEYKSNLKVAVAILFTLPFVAIDLCVNISVFCLSLITRLLSTIVHMICYACTDMRNKAHNEGTRAYF